MDEPVRPVADREADQSCDRMQDSLHKPIDIETPDPCPSSDPAADRLIVGLLVVGALSGPVVLVLAILRWIIMKIF